MKFVPEENFMTSAIEEARIAKASGDLPFGAVVARNGEIISKGHAENNTIGDVTDHAEMSAIRQACKILNKNNLSDCVIYCTNEPCVMCAAAIFQAGISQVVIGASRSDLADLLRPRKITIDDRASDSSYEIEIIRGILKEDVVSLFKGVVRK